MLGGIEVFTCLLDKIVLMGDPIVCSIEWYAEFYGQWDNYRGSFKWQKLINAARQQNIDMSDLVAHRLWLIV